MEVSALAGRELTSGWSAGASGQWALANGSSVRVGADCDSGTVGTVGKRGTVDSARRGAGPGPDTSRAAGSIDSTYRFLRVFL